MFATAPILSPHAGAGAYRQVGVTTGVSTATPHQLVLMLYDGFDEALTQALGALRDGAVDVKCRAIGRAARIVDEGLRANLDNDTAGIEECRRLVRPLREAWASISPATTEAA
jgi:flagellar protein FliS